MFMTVIIAFSRSQAIRKFHLLHKLISKITPKLQLKVSGILTCFHFVLKCVSFFENVLFVFGLIYCLMVFQTG